MPMSIDAIHGGSNGLFVRLRRALAAPVRLRDLSMRLKLPFAFAALALFAVVSVVAVSLLLSRAAQLKSAEEIFALSVESRAAQVSAWTENVASTLLTMSSGKQTIDALYTLSSTFNDLKEDARTVLQNSYIGSNPNPVGQRQLLDRGEGKELYHSEHAKFHKTFRAMLDQHAFYDVFLINRDGDIVYTVAKEVDFADNVSSDVLSNSGLFDVYAQAMASTTHQVFMSDFERYGPSAGSFAVFMAAPIISDMGKTVGVIAVQLAETAMAEIVADGTLIGDSTDIYIVTENARALTPSLGNSKFSVGSTVKDLLHIRDGLSGTAGTLHNVPLQSGEIGSVQTYLLQHSGAPWLLVAERDNADILSNFYALLRSQLLAGFVALLVVALLGIWVARSFAKPIIEINHTINDVAAGNLERALSFTDQKDELGNIARSLDGMRATLAAAKQVEQERAEQQTAQNRVVQNLTDALQSLSDGDLTRTIDQPFDDSYEVLRGYFNDTVQKIRESMIQIAAATEGIRAQSGEISKASEDLAHRTEVQAATLEQTAAAMDEMTASVKSAADGVQEVEVIVTAARKDADACGTVVTEAVTAMAEIEKSSNQISTIIGVIDDIAFQTNLLALNAGVEAARAGDAGRGFAVVASEVGALAQRASTAAREIKTLISTSSQQVEKGVDRVKEAGKALQQIAQRVTHISTLTSDIATGASEQSIGLNEINVGVTQLDQATQKNAAMAEEANAASQLMVSGAEELTHLVRMFKLPPAERHATPVSALALVGDDPMAAPDAGHSGSARKPMGQRAVVARTGTDGDVGAFGQVEVAPKAAVAGNSRGVWQDF